MILVFPLLQGGAGRTQGVKSLSHQTFHGQALKGQSWGWTGDRCCKLRGWKEGQGRALCCVAEMKHGLGCTREGKLCLETAKVKITCPALASLVLWNSLDFDVPQATSLQPHTLVITGETEATSMKNVQAAVPHS